MDFNIICGTPTNPVEEVNFTYDALLLSNCVTCGLSRKALHYSDDYSTVCTIVSLIGDACLGGGGAAGKRRRIDVK